MCRYIRAFRTRFGPAAGLRFRIVHDPVCAAGKRRCGLPEQSPSPAVVGTSVCEGCGERSRASNCLHAGPL
jgi:indolepyruvate ferredoxin oxidoreductase